MEASAGPDRAEERGIEMEWLILAMLVGIIGLIHIANTGLEETQQTVEVEAEVPYTCFGAGGGED
jgi:hypothetical protein